MTRRIFFFVFSIAALLPAGSVRADEKRLETWLMRDQTTMFATFQSHNTKVHAFGSGAIVSYLARYGPDQINDYVVSYVDYEKHKESVLLSGRASTNAPCVARRSEEQFGVIVNDFKSRRIIFNLLSIDSASRQGKVLASAEIPAGVFGKFACAYDGANFLFIGNDGVLMTINAAGVLQRSVRIFQKNDGQGVALEYPQLVYKDSKLHLAFTTSKHLQNAARRFLYWSILYLESRDQGRTWNNRTGAAIELPALIDSSDNAISEANDGSNNRWLVNLQTIGSNVVAEYSDDGGEAHVKQPTIKVWSPDSKQQPLAARLPAEFRGQRQTGIFVEDPKHVDSAYFLTFQGGAMVVLKSNDRGLSWDTWFRSENSFACPYAVDGTRRITASRTILGVITERGQSCALGSVAKNDASVVAFRLRVPD